MSIEGADPDQSAAREPQNVRSRCLADGYLESEIEGHTDEEMESLLDYVVGSTMEECAERLPKMTIWKADTDPMEIATHHLGQIADNR